MNLFLRTIDRFRKIGIAFVDVLRHDGTQAAIGMIWHRAQQSLRYRITKFLSYSTSATQKHPQLPLHYNQNTPLIDGVLFVGYVEANLGLGESLRNLVDATMLTSIHFRVYPFNKNVESRVRGSFHPELYDYENRYAINVIEMATDQLPLLIEELEYLQEKNSYNILRTYWELPQAPESWRAFLTNIDEIWAPTKFVADSFRSIFHGPINLIPPPVVINDGIHRDRSLFNMKEGIFYFIFSFDYFSFPARKNPIGVIRAFRAAFPVGDEKVGLIIKSTSASDQYPEIKSIIRQAGKRDPRIQIIDRTLDRSDILSLINCCDCYVSLHRSEGFGLGMAEAMALEKPVIATAFSGNTDFLNEKTGFPVDFTLRRVKSDEYVHATDQFWADPDQSSAVEAMRIVCGRTQYTREIARNGRCYILNNYGKATVGKQVESRISAIMHSRREKNYTSERRND
jgi:glycosyltransferase involved in cell wall biosynthesis